MKLTQSNIKQLYDQRYKRGYCGNHGQLDYKKALVALEEIPGPVNTVLDYGCGQGGWSELLREVFPNAQISGIDISANAIAKAKERFPENDYFCFDSKVAPFSDASFDLVFSYHVLEHVYEIERTVMDLARLVKSGGWACIIFPCGNEGSFEEKIVKVIKGGEELSTNNEIRFFYEDPAHLRRMKSEKVIELFKSYGLFIYKEFYANQLWGAVNWISKSGPGFLHEFFNFRRATSNGARVKLLAFETLFMPISLLMTLHSINTEKHKSANASVVKKSLIAGCEIGQWLVSPFARSLERLALSEWRKHRGKKNGSEQFLVFKKA